MNFLLISSSGFEEEEDEEEEGEEEAEYTFSFFVLVIKLPQNKIMWKPSFILNYCNSLIFRSLKFLFKIFVVKNFHQYFVFHSSMKKK